MIPALVAVDIRLFRALYGAFGARLEGFAAFLSLVGGGWAMVLLVPAYGVARFRRLTTSLLAALLTTTALVYVIKRAVGRSRPFLALDGVHALTAPPADPSFPSGHASGSFTFAVFVIVVLNAAPPAHLSRGARRLVSAALLLFASSIAWSRVYLGVHFPADVLAGAGLGTLSGVVSARLYLRAEARCRGGLRLA